MIGPPAAERSDHNLLRCIEHFDSKPPSTPKSQAFYDELTAEAHRRGIADKRSEDFPLPPLPPMPWDVHAECAKWEQVGPCVYCVDHGERLYQGSLPDSRDPERPKKRAECAGRGHDWDPDFGQGFYFLCRRCGEKEWTD